ncbi:hypothetical protein NVP1179O_30 [Vibrio phage 1.179.O._10N.286.45.F12]|nr:hypothetical protein NVP1179O_30 [Vibrio phage 1.179.O._10N.286.45.F12]
MNQIEIAREADRKDFVSKMVVAYMQHHGYAPSHILIREWSTMYANL